MEPEESLVSPSVAGTDSEMLGECEIDITDELGRRKAPVHGAGKEGKQRMRKWFVDTVFDGVLVYETQRNIEILLSDDKHTEMTFGRGGVLMQEQFAQLVLNKSCLGWEKSDEVYLCLERDAKKTTHRTSGNLLACISTGVWQEKIKHANTNIQPVPGSGIDVASIRGEDVMPMPPPAKRAKSEASEAASKEENERFHVIALIRHEKTNKSERVFLVNDQDRIFNTLYKEPDVDAYMTAADKWASTFGTAQFVSVCHNSNRNPSTTKVVLFPLPLPFSYLLFFATVGLFRHLQLHSPKRSRHRCGVKNLRS